MADGGLGIMPFDKHARLLKLRCGAQLTERHKTAEVTMAEELIKVDLRSGPFKREQRFWSPQEAILLKVPIHTTAKTVDSIL